jgi:hypothetical protein
MMPPLWGSASWLPRGHLNQLAYALYLFIATLPMVI